MYYLLVANFGRNMLPRELPIYRVSQEERTKLRRVFLMLKYTDITQNTYIKS